MSGVRWDASPLSRRNRAAGDVARAAERRCGEDDGGEKGEDQRLEESKRVDA